MYMYIHRLIILISFLESNVELVEIIKEGTWSDPRVNIRKRSMSIHHASSSGR